MRKILNKIKIQYLLPVLLLFIAVFFNGIINTIIEIVIEKAYINFENSLFMQWTFILICLIAVLIILKLNFQKIHLEFYIFIIYMLYKRFDIYWIYTKTFSFNRVTYYDVILFSIIISVIIVKFSPSKQDVKNESNFSSLPIIGERPISSEDEDKFDFKDNIQNLSNRIIATLGSSQSVSIFINGKWGTGKTSYLNLLKLELIKSKIRCISFNPWKLDTNKSYTSILFDKIIDEISCLSRYEKSIIQNYLENLNVISKKKIKWFSSNENPENEIKTLFRKLNTNIVIFLDDLDRLLVSEIIDILKMIRNTIDIPQLIFISALDIEHVYKCFERIEIEDPYEYLKKYYQLIIDIPIYSKKDFINELFNNGIFDDSENNELNDVINCLSSLIDITPRKVVLLHNYIINRIYTIRPEYSKRDYILLMAIKVFYPKYYINFKTLYLSTVQEEQVMTEKQNVKGYTKDVPIQSFSFNHEKSDFFLTEGQKSSDLESIKVIMPYLFPKKLNTSTDYTRRINYKMNIKIFVQEEIFT